MGLSYNERQVASQCIEASRKLARQRTGSEQSKAQWQASHRGRWMVSLEIAVQRATIKAPPETRANRDEV
tara:strand:+ start:208 stop:417 length:210 start_codon:yes stop_codon:yes gene_type:complete